MSASYLCLANIRHDGRTHRAGSVLMAEPRAVEGLLRLGAIAPQSPGAAEVAASLAEEGSAAQSEAEAKEAAAPSPQDADAQAPTAPQAAEPEGEDKPAARRKRS